MNTAQATSNDDSCILIVDDEEDVRESLRDLVELIGCSAVLAASAEEGLAVLVDRKPCAVVLDLLMPGMSGADMLEAMRRDPTLAEVPVVISTSAPERAPRGANVMAKPIDVDLMCAWMRRHCHCA